MLESKPPKNLQEKRDSLCYSPNIIFLASFEPTSSSKCVCMYLFFGFSRCHIKVGNTLDKTQTHEKGYQFSIHINLFMRQILYIIDVNLGVRQEITLMLEHWEFTWTLIGRLRVYGTQVGMSCLTQNYYILNLQTLWVNIKHLCIRPERYHAFILCWISEDALDLKEMKGKLHGWNSLLVLSPILKYFNVWTSHWMQLRRRN